MPSIVNIGTTLFFKGPVWSILSVWQLLVVRYSTGWILSLASFSQHAMLQPDTSYTCAHCSKRRFFWQRYLKIMGLGVLFSSIKKYSSNIYGELESSHTVVFVCLFRVYLYCPVSRLHYLFGLNKSYNMTCFWIRVGRLPKFLWITTYKYATHSCSAWEYK